MTKPNISLNKDKIAQIRSYWTRNPSGTSRETGVNKCLQHLAKKQDDGLESYLADYVIICSVAEIEVFFKHSAMSLIDDFYCPLPDVHVATSLDELKLLTQVTFGKIAVNEFNFQNISDIDKIFTNLLGLKFLTWLKNQGVAISKIVELINLRHEIVHELKSFDKTLEELDIYTKAVHGLVSTSAGLFLELFGPDHNDIGD